MRGYTDGLQRSLSEKSLGRGLAWESYELDKEVTGRALCELALDTIENDVEELGRDRETLLDHLESNNYLVNGDDFESDSYDEFDLDTDTNTLWACTGIWELIDNLSEGGLVLITDTDKDVLGARFNVAGEHIGSVSVVLDTYAGTVSGWGETLPISDSDCADINEHLADIY